MKRLISFFFLLVLTAGSVIAGPVVLFDEGHGQRFLAGGDRPLDLSGLAGLFREGGCSVVISPAPLDRELLETVDILVISGAFQPFTASEVDAVEAFVRQGGNLAVMLHIGPPVGPLLHRLEVDFSNGTIRETRNLIDGRPQDFVVADLVAHPLTKNLSRFSLFGAWALRATQPQSMVLARTSPRAWVDLNRDRRLSPGDAVQSFGVLVAGEVGQGRYVVFGDDALFQNRFLDQSARQLVVNMLEWFSSTP